MAPIAIQIMFNCVRVRKMKVQIEKSRFLSQQDFHRWLIRKLRSKLPIPISKRQVYALKVPSHRNPRGRRCTLEPQFNEASRSVTKRVRDFDLNSLPSSSLNCNISQVSDDPVCPSVSNLLKAMRCHQANHFEPCCFASPDSGRSIFDNKNVRGMLKAEPTPTKKIA